MVEQGKKQYQLSCKKQQTLDSIKNAFIVNCRSNQNSKSIKGVKVV